MQTNRFLRLWFVWLVLAAACVPLAAQERAAPRAGGLVVEVEPAALTLAVGGTARLTATVRRADGTVVDDAAVVFYSRARRSVSVTRRGDVEAHRPGEFTLVALVPANRAAAGLRSESIARAEVAVTVPHPPVDRVRFAAVPPKFYVGTRPRLAVEVVDASGAVRPDVAVEYASADPAVASIDRHGFLSLARPGSVELSVRAGDASDTLAIEVEANPVASLTLQASAESVRTGDVVVFAAAARDARGLAVRGVPVQYAVAGETAPAIIAAGAAALVTSEGRFVAERSGTYTVVATTGSHTARRTVEVRRRDVGREVEVVGRGRVLDRHTSDLWIWEAADGRDYALTGTWGSDGSTYIWDVTDPADIRKVREIQVDARTVNDVKVSEGGDIAVISREGASDRRNGIVILGVGNPREGVPVLAEYTDMLTGGVHNLFIAEDHVYALSAGRRYDVIDIADPANPRRVGRFELETPNHSVHDVWVSDGVAFSSNWTDGVVAVDVGGGGRGGTPARPVELGRYAYPSGWNHAAFPYRSPSTGKLYVFAGDESFAPQGRLYSEQDAIPTLAAGWIHVIDWTDWERPREVARYQVPEAGSHNLWVEDDTLYVGYYNGGLRVVDVSGELLGDLYRQGREMARFLPFDPDGFIANAPFVWGPQPFKGHVFFSDWNTGLWAVRLVPRTRPAPIVGEPQ